MGVAWGATVKSRGAINWENKFPSCEVKLSIDPDLGTMQLLSQTKYIL